MPLCGPGCCDLADTGRIRSSSHSIQSHFWEPPSGPQPLRPPGVHRGHLRACERYPGHNSPRKSLALGRCQVSHCLKSPRRCQRAARVEDHSTLVDSTHLGRKQGRTPISSQTRDPQLPQRELGLSHFPGLFHLCCRMKHWRARDLTELRTRRKAGRTGEGSKSPLPSPSQLSPTPRLLPEGSFCNAQEGGPSPGGRSHPVVCLCTSPETTNGPAQSLGGGHAFSWCHLNPI